MHRPGSAGDPGTRTVEEDRVVEILLAGGWAREVRDGGRPAADQAARAALACWSEMGLPVVRDAAGLRRYDSVEVLNFMKWATLRGGDRVWPERFVTTGRGLVLAQHAGWQASGTPEPAALPPRRFEVRLERSFNLSSVAPGTPLRLRLPLPLEGEMLAGLRLQIDAAGDAVRFSRSPGRLEARMEAPREGQVTLGYSAAFTATPHRPAPGEKPASVLAAGEAALYTRPAEGFIRASPRVAALADALAGPGADPRDAVGAFWEYLLDRMSFGAVHYHEIDRDRPMDWLLDHGWYDCEIGSALLVSLCRARGIPARISSGYMLYPLAPGYHFWAEVWLGGWTPFDLLCWDLSAGGRDAAWRDAFAGGLDYRMQVERLPLHFVGPMSVKLPRRWRILTQLLDGGLRTSICELASGETVYSDDVSVTVDRA